MLNNYEIVKPLKKIHNGNSEVYEIKDRNTERHYVLKIIKGINTPLYNVIFEREVGALNKLRTCEGIVRLEHFDTYNDENFGECGRIFLELINGQTLEETDVIELSTSEKYEIINQLIKSVQIAHENCIIHRDINPKNIMITDDKKVKLIDFGISKIKDMINSETLYQFATNRYAAPEVHRHSENATEKSDIYSLGAVMYFIFTGEEPPNSDEFENKLNETGGIDIELKEIIKKMIKVLPDERYTDIFEVRKALLKLFSRFSKRERTFIISIPTGKMDYMRNLSLVPNKVNYHDLVQINIYEDFLESYINIEGENTEKEKYVIYGIHYYFECTYNESSQLFHVVKVNKLQPYRREEIKRKSMFLNGEVKFIISTSGRKPPKNNNFELTNDVRDYKDNYLSSLNVNNEYSKNFFVWHKLLEIMEEEYKRNVMKITYNDFNIENEYCIFNIDEKSYYLIDDEKKSELTFIFERDNGRKKRAVEIGNYESIYIEDERFLLKVSLVKTSVISQLPKKGIISEDFRKNLSLINREMKAISAFNNEEYASTSNLKSIFSGISYPNYFNDPQNLSFFNDRLDSAQKAAVRKALNSQDISLIQGPPGTGKTNVIIEIIRQIFEINKKGNIFKQKILLVSQAHPAVDKMLEDLDNSTSDNNKVIRIGRDENLTEMVKEKYAVDYAQARWVNKIISNSNEAAEKYLTLLGIDKNEFNQYYEAKIEQKTSRDRESIIFKQAETIIEKFESKYNKLLNKKDFKALIIQKDWVNKVIGTNDIQQHFIKNAVIVAGTCTGFVSNYVISDMIFDYVIIDEAAKATFPELLISIIRAKKIIMVGDHKQLPPVLDNELIKNSSRKFVESGLDYKNLYNSIFMKLFEHIPTENKQVLNTQYRMHPTIGTMISKLFYDNEICNGVPMSDRSHSIKQYENLAIVWIDTSKSKDRFEDQISTTYRNLLEANVVKEQLKIINDSSKEHNYDIGVITPYSAQKNLIKKEIQPIIFDNIKNEIVVNSVDAFQGGQKDIIIYSTVRSSDKHKKIGFLKSEERLNVAFSRAKRLLIIVGDAYFLNDSSIVDNRFPEIIKYIRENEDCCRIIDYMSIYKRDKAGK